MQTAPGSSAPPKRQAAVLSSRVYNEAETLFKQLESNDERHCVSTLDCLTLMRGMGMNPTQDDLDELQRNMAPLIRELDEAWAEEERKREALKKKEEAKAGKGDAKKDAKKDPKKDGKDGKKEGEGEGEGEEGEKKNKRRVLADPPEELKNIDWHIFITNVEPLYKDAQMEKDEIVSALKVFDKDGKNKIKFEDLIRILERNGESVLAPGDALALKAEMDKKGLASDVFDFADFAEFLNGTYQPPPPPTAEEIARMEEEKRKEEEERRKREQNENFDALLGSGSSPAGNPVADPASPTGDAAAS